ncbi:MAG TPA: OmpH family outer membrane protein [Acidobacteriaceae bacterium]|nr:OmpH family outer membrane protein [Acidobacteriaceae bacterium]
MNRVFSRSIFVTSLLVAGLGLSALAQTSSAPARSTATAHPTGTTKVAVINFQAAVFQTNEGRAKITALQQKFDPKRAQLKAEADEINTLKKQLQASASTLSDAQRASRTEAIDEKEKTLQRDGEDASGQYQQEMQQTYQELAEKVYGVLQTYAKENGYGVVLDESAGAQGPPTVLWRNDSTDITKAVITAYNAQSPAATTPNAIPSAPPAHGGGTSH